MSYITEGLTKGLTALNQKGLEREITDRKMIEDLHRVKKAFYYSSFNDYGYLRNVTIIQRMEDGILVKTTGTLISQCTANRLYRDRVYFRFHVLYYEEGQPLFFEESSYTTSWWVLKK